MHGLNTFYGIDIKITPDGTPYVIEMNGVNSGTDFYKTPQCEEFYRRAAKKFARVVGKKPFLIDCSSCLKDKNTDEFVSTNKKSVPKKKSPSLEKTIIDGMSALLPFEREWFDQYFQDAKKYFAKSDSDGYPNESAFYAAAARSEGIDARLFVDMNYSEDKHKYEIMVPYFAKGKDGLVSFNNGKVIYSDDEEIAAYSVETLTDAQIGLVWANERTLNKIISFGQAPNKRFINSTALEVFLNSKSVFYNYVEHMQNRNQLPMITPRTFVYIAGYTSPHELAEFVSSLEGKLVVIKPSCGDCGLGVRITQKKQLLTKIKRHGTCRNLLLDDPLYFSYVSLMPFVIQEFIPSKQVIANDGKPRDGCIRGIIINGNWVGGQWRLASKPIHHNCSYISRFRCNLSQGAFAHPLSDNEEALVASFAEKTIKSFEAEIKPGIFSPEYIARTWIMLDTATSPARLFSPVTNKR